MSDDLDCRIRSFGDPVAITPNIDRLARRGVRFDRAYCQYPLCNPTRSSVLSGMYPTTTGVLDNNTYLVLDKGQMTMPDYFEHNGPARALAPRLSLSRGPRPVFRRKFRLDSCSLYFVFRHGLRWLDPLRTLMISISEYRNLEDTL